MKRSKVAKSAQKRPAPKLAWPYEIPEWPKVNHDVGHAILDILCGLLAPVGEYRQKYVIPSKGKRSRNRVARSQAGDPISQAPPDQGNPSKRSDIENFVTIGFNSTYGSLETEAAGARPRCMVPDPGETGALSAGHQNRNLAAVFLDRSSQPAMMHNDLPLLVKAASHGKSQSLAVRLVALPSGAEARLREALGIPCVGLIGVSRDAVDAKKLLDLVEQVPVVDIPWMESVTTGKYWQTKVDIGEPATEVES